MEPANEVTGPLPRLPSSSPPRNASSHHHPADPTANATSSQTPNANGSSKDRPVSGIVPPYWSHHRNASRTSQSSLEPLPPITLEDHTEDPNSETSRGLWARSVSVDDHVVVQGKTGIGAYVVWNCTIQTLEGGPITIRMRYSEFDDLRRQLVASFPYARNALPALPPKSVLFKFRPSFLESRRVGLEYFLNCVLLNPEFSSSPIVKDFLFGRMC
ncbi:Phox homologous domain-containing protein [Aspergillus floccosus]